ncbi:hypothetical protein AKJ41_03365 [candidate division MSBL1 archaeon SCGC-AAA259O05]|uniref:Uncharacterized protein n=1 Tax=candidate division MSBL1 archaeon SCGC-AAA259O05 TaxID=1698271 RepID=A0A133V3C6_9EURY|nr:hypothetical protein AKJ41_03365 [candidate division MSBL1 archaeon SCGC-AAA259O05]
MKKENPSLEICLKPGYLTFGKTLLKLPNSLHAPAGEVTPTVFGFALYLLDDRFCFGSGGEASHERW